MDEWVILGWRQPIVPKGDTPLHIQWCSVQTHLIYANVALCFAEQTAVESSHFHQVQVCPRTSTVMTGPGFFGTLTEILLTHSSLFFRDCT